MSAHYYFQDFSRFEHLENFLRERIQGVIDAFIPNGRYNFTARIHTVRARSDHKKPHFLCEVRLDTPENPTSIVVKKKSSNFYHAAIQVARILKKVLRRRSTKRAQHNRRAFRQLERSHRENHNLPKREANNDLFD